MSLSVTEVILLHWLVDLCVSMISFSIFIKCLEALKEEIVNKILWVVQI